MPVPFLFQDQLKDSTTVEVVVIKCAIQDLNVNTVVPEGLWLNIFRSFKNWVNDQLPSKLLIFLRRPRPFIEDH